VPPSPRPKRSGRGAGAACEGLLGDQPPLGQELIVTKGPASSRTGAARPAPGILAAGFWWRTPKGESCRHDPNHPPQAPGPQPGSPGHHRPAARSGW
jgi:hypothetical protein